MVIDKCRDEGQDREHRLETERAISLLGKDESELEMQLAAKKLEIDELSFELTSVRAVKNRYQRRAELLRSAEAEASAEAKVSAEPEVSGGAEFQEMPICGAATVADISDCKFQYEALRRIARLNHGVLELSKAVDVVIAAMAPRGKRASVMSTQGKRIRKSEEWTRIRKGVYRLVAFNASNIAEVDTRKLQRAGRSERSRPPKMDRKAA